MPGTCVPLTETSTSIPSSPSELLSRSPSELEEEELLGRPPVGIELPEDEAVVPELELLELEELDELDAEGIEGEPDREELDADGMEGELELELDDDGIDCDDEELELEDEGIEGEDDELLELELEEVEGIEGDELELLWLVSVAQEANIRLKADTVTSVLTGRRANGLFMVLSRVLLMVLPLS